MEVNIYYKINTPIVKVVSKYFIAIDNYTSTNSKGQHYEPISVYSSN